LSIPAKVVIGKPSNIREGARTGGNCKMSRKIPVPDETRLKVIQEQDHPPLYRASEKSSIYYIIKRILDIAVSLILLVLLSPLMILIAVMIFVYSPGPIFFMQERVGAKRYVDGKSTCWKNVRFRCFKFRTMKINADPAIHKAYVKALIVNDEKQMAALQGELTKNRKLIHDPRIIRPGLLLRKLSLDELPQLWNVLRGDMSLVGPRPAIPYEVELYQPWHWGRLQAQPGLTGLQQVTARCITDFDEQVRLDIEYVESQSIWLDLRIMLQTPLAIISTKGAY
jgi:lipopolysaccharide/colanic/teichoic acid biosynthesis glycosyltransferase